MGGAPLLVFLALLSIGLFVEIFRAFRRLPGPGLKYVWPVLAYVLLGIACFYFLRQENRAWPLAALMTVVMADTAAYLVGKKWGRAPLAPSVSPAKTREGAAAGVFLSASAVAWFLSSTTSIRPSVGAVLGAGLAVLAVLGDLLESWIKRRLGIKDFGSSLPGHGGIFDRIDSLLAVSIGLYIFSRFVSL